MTRKAASVGLALLVPGGVALALYLLMRDRDDDRDLDDARHAEEASALWRLRSSGTDPAEVEVLAESLLARAPSSAAVSYAEELLAAATRFKLDPLILAAIVDHESGWGFAPGYTPRGGPNGAGDRARRKLYGKPRSEWPAELYIKDAGEDSRGVYGYLLPPTWPGGGVGFGLGFMQIDAYWQADWAFSTDDAGRFLWPDPAENIEKGARVFRGCLTAFDDLGPAEQLRAALAAYNAGTAKVRKLIDAGQSPDAGTTGGNYAADVLARFTRFGGDAGVLV